MNDQTAKRDGGKVAITLVPMEMVYRGRRGRKDETKGLLQLRCEEGR